MGGELIKGCIFLSVWVDGPINGAGGGGYGLTGLTGQISLKVKTDISTASIRLYRRLHLKRVHLTKKPVLIG